MATRGQSKVNLVTVIIAAVLGLGAGFGLVVFTSGDSSEQPDLASMADVQLQESPDAATEAGGAAAPSEPAEPTEPSESVELSESAGAGDTVLASCMDAAARADDAVAAAQESLGNWKTHYGAQVAFDRGQITADEAKRRWAESKAPAQDNIDAFVEAREAVPGNDPCGEGESEGLGDDDRQLAQQCTAQLAAYSDVMSSADPPMEAWRDHIAMMANRDQYPVDEYLAIWRQTVADAPGPMKAFEEAASAYDEIGSCDAQG